MYRVFDRVNRTVKDMLLISEIGFQFYKHERSLIFYINQKKYFEHKSLLCLIAAESLGVCPDKLRTHLRDDLKIVFEGGKDLKELSLWEINKIFDLFRYYGSFENAFLVKKYYIERLINFQQGAATLQIKALQACIESDCPGLVLEFIRKKRKRVSDRKKIHDIEWFCMLLEQNKFRPRSLSLINVISDRRKIYGGKKINVIGPALCVDRINQISCDNHSLCILPNFIPGRESRFKDFVRKPFSYFNGEKFANNFDEIIHVASRVDIIFVKALGHFLAASKKLGRHKVRLARQPYNIMLNDYGPNHIQNIIFDVLHGSPKEINVFGVTAFLGEKLSRDGYKDSRSANNSVRSGIRFHEPFSNFLFLKNLSSRGLINADEMTANILSLDVLDYAKALDAIYGKYDISSID